MEPPKNATDVTKSKGNSTLRCLRRAVGITQARPPGLPTHHPRESLPRPCRRSCTPSYEIRRMEVPVRNNEVFLEKHSMYRSTSPGWDEPFEVRSSEEGDRAKSSPQNPNHEGRPNHSVRLPCQSNSKQQSIYLRSVFPEIRGYFVEIINETGSSSRSIYAKPAQGHKICIHRRRRIQASKVSKVRTADSITAGCSDSRADA